jgi:hypothetical protein
MYTPDFNQMDVQELCVFTEAMQLYAQKTLGLDRAIAIGWASASAEMRDVIARKYGVLPAKNLAWDESP